MEKEKKQKKMNVFVFILLLILFWPLAIVYAVVKNRNKADTEENENNKSQKEIAREEEINNILATDNDIVYCLDGAQRILKVYEDKIILVQKKNARSLLTGDMLNGEKTIYYSDMLGIQFKLASNVILGFIQFETGSTSNKGNFGSENSFTFEMKINETAQKVKSYCEGQIKKAKNPTTVAALSSADELKKFKELYDSGIITEEEFNEKKKQLLGL